MGPTTVLAAVALATVFVVSGLAKLADRDGTRQAVTGFGVPTRFVTLIAFALAPAELVVAVLLVWPATTAVGLVGAGLLLAAFTAAVIVAMLTGRRPECHCFGRIGGADVSVRTVLRNVALIALAGVGLVSLRSPELELTAGEAMAGIGAGLAVAGLVLLGEGMAGRAARRARARRDEAAYERGMAGGRPDAEAPEFRVGTLDGAEVSLTELLSPGLPLLLVFLSPGCGPCRTLRPAVTRWAEVYAGRLTVAVVGSGGLGANAAAYDDQVPQVAVLLDEDDTLRVAYGVRGTPAAVLVEPTGQLRGGVVASGERLVRRLLAAALAGAEFDTGHHDHAHDSGVPADTIGLSSTPFPRRTVTAHQVQDDTILVDEAEGSSLSLDRIGAVVWSVLDGESALDEIVADLADVFGTGADVIGPDVLDMVRSLGRAGMLEGVAAEAVPDEIEPVHAGAAPSA